MKILFNTVYTQTKPSSLNKNNQPKMNFQGSIHFDTFEKSNFAVNKVFEHLCNMNNIVRYVNNNITAGETLANHDNKFFEQLSKWGVKTVIDLREFDKNYQRKCENNGIKYVSVPLAHVYKDKKDGVFEFKPDGRTQANVKDCFVKQIKILLEYMKKGNVYIGCQYGVDRTNLALVLDYILNYNSTHRAPKIYPSNFATRRTLRNKNINLVKKIIKRLSNEQRDILNIPDDFENTILYKRIGEIVQENNKKLTYKDIFTLEKKMDFDLFE